MAKQLLLNPRVLIDNAKLLLSVNIKIVRALLVQKRVLRIEYFETTRHVVIFKPKEISLGKSELLFLGVIDDPLHILSSKTGVLHQCRSEEYP